jgi:hypothetical protein
MDLRQTGWGGTDWTELAQYTDHKRALVNTFGFHKLLGAAQLVAPREGLSCIKLLRVGT